MPPLLLFHICAGTIGLLSGAVAAILRKGSRRHAIAGQVFVASMLSMAASGTCLAALKNQPSNIVGGLLTFYLVATAWGAARQANGRSGLFDWAGLAVALGVAAGSIAYGVEAAGSPRGMKAGVPAGMFFFLGSVVLLAAGGDIRLLVRGGISGRQRMVRHLWRMCFGLFIAAGSVFLARPQVFPPFLRKTSLPIILTVLPFALMAFWLIRVRFFRAFLPGRVPARSVQPAAAIMAHPAP